MKLKTGAIAAGLVATGLALTHVAVSQPAPGRGGFTLPGVDADGDGLITRSEADAAVDARFRVENPSTAILRISEATVVSQSNGTHNGLRLWWRSSGDGALSLAELQAVRPELTQERFAEMDRNDDGLITTDERPMRGPRGGGRRPFGPPAQ